MSKLEFKTSSTLNSKILIKHIMDFEYYSKYFPLQIKEVKIIEEKNNEIITEEKIIFRTLVKNVIEQKSLHKKTSENKLITEILEGPAKGTIVNIFCNDVSSGSEIIINVDLKLSLKAIFLKPLIKKFYQKYLTALIFKITNRVESL
jgi:hypothetical protein|tara:strand:+ start:1059 stop:1499 length:441 start_codon:yes stop_codon:yes gene_type:complete